MFEFNATQYHGIDTLERMVFISFVDLKLVEDINPSKFGGLHGVEPFWNIKQGETALVRAP